MSGPRGFCTVCGIWLASLLCSQQSRCCGVDVGPPRRNVVDWLVRLLEAVIRIVIDKFDCAALRFLVPLDDVNSRVDVRAIDRHGHAVDVDHVVGARDGCCFHGSVLGGDDEVNVGDAAVNARSKGGTGAGVASGAAHSANVASSHPQRAVENG